MAVPNITIELADEIVDAIEAAKGSFPALVHTVERSWFDDVDVKNLTESKMSVIPRYISSTGDDSARDSMARECGFTFVLKSHLQRPTINQNDEIDELVNTLDAVVELFEQHDIDLPISNTNATQYGVTFEPIVDEEMLRRYRVFHSQFDAIYILERSLAS